MPSTENEETNWEGYGMRTDLAVEAHEIVRGSRGRDLPGVFSEVEDLDGIKVTRVHVQNAVGARLLGKKIGRYVTLEVPGLRNKNPELQERVTASFVEEFRSFLSIDETKTILVVGLGNWNVTPDSLGPLVVENVFVTRHIFENMPELVEDGYRPLCAVAPGVLGITGIETSEVVHGIVENVKPDMIIAIDALASRSLDRVNTTIQIADTGISPGSGVGNKRKAIDEDTLGVPVLAVGVPTVVDAVTIVHDTLKLLIERLESEVPGNSVGRTLNQFDEGQKKQLLFELLQPIGNNLMVTPKEIDAFVEDIANIVANGLNMAIHPAIDEENTEVHTH